MAKLQFIPVSKQYFQTESRKVQKMAANLNRNGATWGPASMVTRGIEHDRERLMYSMIIKRDKKLRGLFVRQFRREGTARWFMPLGPVKKYGLG